MESTPESRPAAAAVRSGRSRPLVAALAVVAVLGLAIAAAAATPHPASGLNLAVERVSAGSSGFLGDVGALLPLGFAFTAGMVSSVNPCGFPLLPAYLGIFLADEAGPGGARPAVRALHALKVGGLVTVGFVALFSTVGLTVGAGARVVVDWLPWIALALGVALVLLGGYALAGGALYTSLPQRMSARIQPGGAGLGRYLGFGLAYGLASLSCTLPIFLAVVGTSVTVGSVWSSLGSLVAYGLGMGSVVLALTLVAAVIKAGMATRLRTLLPHVGRIGTITLLIAGAYIVYYWLTVGALLERLA